MAEENEDEGIEGLLIESVVGISILPDGNVALIVRNADTPVGLVFSPEDAEEAAALLASANQNDDGGLAGK